VLLLIIIGMIHIMGHLLILFIIVTIVRHLHIVIGIGGRVITIVMDTSTRIIWIVTGVRSRIIQVLMGVRGRIIQVLMGVRGLRVSSKINSHFRISASGHLWPLLNREVLKIARYSCGFAQS
jgi:hypothetical protein